TQAYHTEQQYAQTEKTRQPCWGTHAPYNTRRFELIKQRNGAASSKPGFIAMKMLDVILTQLPAVVIAISRIEVGEPQPFDFDTKLLESSSPLLECFMYLGLEAPHLTWLLCRLQLL